MSNPKIGPRLSAAIALIVSTLQHLRSEGTAVPTATRDPLSQIKAKYASDHARGDMDPLEYAGRAWAHEQIAQALEEDNKTAATAEDTPAGSGLKSGENDAALRSGAGPAGDLTGGSEGTGDHGGKGTGEKPEKLSKADRRAAIDLLVEENNHEQLQDLAREADLPVSGTKAELAERIIDAKNSIE